MPQLQSKDQLIYSKLGMLNSESLKQELLSYINYLLSKQINEFEETIKEHPLKEVQAITELSSNATPFSINRQTYTINDSISDSKNDNFSSVKSDVEEIEQIHKHVSIIDKSTDLFPLNIGTENIKSKYVQLENEFDDLHFPENKKVKLIEKLIDEPDDLPFPEIKKKKIRNISTVFVEENLELEDLDKNEEEKMGVPFIRNSSSFVNSGSFQDDDYDNFDVSNNSDDDPFGDIRDFYGGFSQDEVDSGIADAYEGDYGNYNSDY